MVEFSLSKHKGPKPDAINTEDNFKVPLSIPKQSQNGSKVEDILFLQLVVFSQGTLSIILFLIIDLLDANLFVPVTLNVLLTFWLAPS